MQCIGQELRQEDTSNPLQRTALLPAVSSSGHCGLLQLCGGSFTEANKPKKTRAKDSRQRAPDIVIITGLSGSGMSSATNAFEDLGYFCVDNLPLTMLPTFARLVTPHSDEKGIERAALVIDIREGIFSPTSENN